MIPFDPHTLTNPIRIGIGADHGGFELKRYLAELLRVAAYRVLDFGDDVLDRQTITPILSRPLALSVSRHEIDRGIAICGSGVGVS